MSEAPDIIFFNGKVTTLDRGNSQAQAIAIRDGRFAALMATFIANRFWEMAGVERFMAANSLFEHLGLVGGFVLIAWYDLREKKGISGL